MKIKADLHIHTVLSPCGDLAMSPSAIVEQAKNLDINVIGITDHNSTLNAEVAFNLAAKEGIYVLMGSEVTTREEVHCLCFMPDFETLKKFQEIIESKVVYFENSVDKFGYQLIVDENEDIVDQVPYLLINALDLGISELQEIVQNLKGIFVPAHVDRKDTSISSQLGFVPDDLKFDALELSPYAERNNFFERFPWFQPYNYIRDSDAHFIEDIGKSFNIFEVEKVDFENLRKAIKEGYKK